MEPWTESYARSQKKGLVEKAIGAVVVIYAGFAIFVFATAAESVTIPLARRWRRRQEKKNEGR